MKTYTQLITETLPHISERLPWDVEKMMAEGLLLLDVREPREFDVMRIADSINAPRGILEQCCEWNYIETMPELAAARDEPVLTICRSGNRSALAAYTMQQLGYQRVYSLKTGLSGWHDYDLPLVDQHDQPIEAALADQYFNQRIRKEQRKPRVSD